METSASAVVSTPNCGVNNEMEARRQLWCQQRNGGKTPTVVSTTKWRQDANCGVNNEMEARRQLWCQQRNGGKTPTVVSTTKWRQDANCGVNNEMEARRQLWCQQRNGGKTPTAGSDSATEPVTCGNPGVRKSHAVVGSMVSTFCTTGQ